MIRLYDVNVAQIASGLATELMVSLLHAPLRERTPAEGVAQEDDEAEEYSTLPHQIRGFLSRFLQVQPVVILLSI